MIKDYFKFTQIQRSGIFGLFLIMAVLQMICYFVDFNDLKSRDSDGQKWLSVQTQFDSLKKESKHKNYKMASFNPNFISDYKGYKLGMSVVQIDRLFAFRKQNKYVNSVQEFQNVTKVPDSLLATMAPYFKFPVWVGAKSRSAFSNKDQKPSSFSKVKNQVLDINDASKEDLMRVYGIGDVISDRIIEQKNRMGGFVSMEQMKDVWGLSPEVFQKLNESFAVVQLPEVKRIAINDVSLKELSAFYYFKNPLARKILIYRSMNGNFKNIEDLTKVEGFPVEKYKIIALYLVF